MPGADEFCTRDPHLEGEEVFGSQKRKLDTTIGADDKTHRPDTFNFSRPRAAKRITRARVSPLPAIVEERDPDVVEVVPSPPSATGVRHVTAVEETKVDERLWHIARLPKTSSKACWAQQAVTKKKKCVQKIVKNGKSTPAPTYTGTYISYKLNRVETMPFFFCADDIECCVKGSRRKWVTRFSDVEDRPPIPAIWPVKIGTNLKGSEILALERAGFQLPSKQQVSPRRLFSTAPPSIDLSSYPVPVNPDQFPGNRKSKKVRRSAAVPTNRHWLSIDSAAAIKATVLKVSLVPTPGFGCVITLCSKSMPMDSIYQLTISSFPDCNCEAFKETMRKFGKKGNSFRYCKHVYYVFTKICGLDPKVDRFMHAPTFSFNEIKLVLERGILVHSSSKNLHPATKQHPQEV